MAYRQMEVPNDAPDLGALYGLIGTTQGLVFQDRNGQPDFSQCPPQVQNPPCMAPSQPLPSRPAARATARAPT